MQPSNITINTTKIKELIVDSLNLDNLEGLNAFMEKSQLSAFDPKKKELLDIYIKLLIKIETYKKNLRDQDPDNDLWVSTTDLNFAIFVNKYAGASTNEDYWNTIIDIISKNADDDIDVKIETDFRLCDDEVARYVDAAGDVVESFLPMNQYRLCSMIKENIAPYNAAAIGIYDSIDATTPSRYLILNKLNQTFGHRLYRVGIMSDIHYNDDYIDGYDSVLGHPDGSGEYIQDLTNALEFYEQKDEVRFICAAGDVTTNDMAHMINFKSMIDQTCPTTPFYTCFGNHDYCATAKYNSIDDKYADYAQLGVLGKTRLDMWNSLMVPQNGKYEIHYQNPETGYGRSSFWFEAPTTNGKSDIYAFLSVNYLDEANRLYSQSDKEYHNMIPSQMIIDKSKDGGECEIVADTGYDICIRYSASSQRMLYDYHNILYYTKTVKILDSKVTDADGVDITDMLDLDNPLIGIFGTDGKYHLAGEFEANQIWVSSVADLYTFEIPISSKFATTYPNIKLPVTLYLNAQIVSQSGGFEYNSTATANVTLDDNSLYMDDIKQYLIDNGITPPSAYNIKFYDNAALLWLKDLLETYPEKRIFIFTHQFFPQKSGNNIGPGYSYGMDNWRIQEGSSYCLCGIQFEFLNLLNNKYRNSIWFTGHSHYNYDTQITDKTVTVCNHDYEIYRPGDNDFSQDKRYWRRGELNLSDIGIGENGTKTCESGYNIHVPSTSRPLASNHINSNIYSNTYELSDGYGDALQTGDSEGLIMDIYENYVDLRGVTFKDDRTYPGKWINKYHPLGQYRIYIKSK